MESKQLFLLFELLLAQFYIVSCSGSMPRIGIIGGGIGGTSCAYYLRQLFGKDTEITLFESSQIGGRLSTIEIGDHFYESGGSIIHPANKYMVQFAELLNLTREHLSGRFALFNGKEIVFEGSNSDIILISKLLWHYGLDPIYLNFFIKDMLSNFSQIYRHQEENLAFLTVDALLESMSPLFEQLLHQQFHNFLIEKGFHKKFIDELIASAINSNYGQSTFLHAFVGSVAIAGAHPGLWRVAGGNRQVAEKLIDLSAVKLMQDHVTSVDLLVKQSLDSDVSEYMIKTRSSPVGTAFDIVVIALPLEAADNSSTPSIAFNNFPQPIWTQMYGFEKIIATFVNGTPNYSYFGYASELLLPDGLLVTTKDTFFNSIGRQKPVDKNLSKADEVANSVWKVFSASSLTSAQLDKLFVSRTIVKEVTWHAYPHYPQSIGVHTLQPFELHRNLYYINSIEMAASAMEMSVISARNVALLASHRWNAVHELVVSRNLSVVHSSFHTSDEL